jgi:hypothetical protein
MADGKIEVKVGEVFFCGEGDGKWVSEQFDKMMKHLPDLVAVAPTPHRGEGGSAGRAAGAGKAAGTLASFLTSTNSKTNQTRRFLATAFWLQNAGKTNLSTTMVSKALSDAHQNRLTNPSQCLADNVKQGFCEKQGKKEFYVTDEGATEIEGRGGAA